MSVDPKNSPPPKRSDALDVNRRLVVAGDVSNQFHLSNPAPTPHANPEPAPSSILDIEKSLGGAVLLMRLIKGFLRLDWNEDFGKEIDHQEELSSEHHLWKHVVDKKKKETQKVYDRFLGYGREKKRHPGFSKSFEAKEKNSPTIVMLDDCNIAFRETDSAWPAEMKSSAKRAEVVVLKTTYPFNENRNLLFSHCVQKYAEKLIVVFSDDDLRRMDIQLTKNLAWETALDDLIESLRTNFKLDHLRRCRWLVLPIATSGIVVIQNPLPRKGPEPLQDVQVGDEQQRVFRVIDPVYFSAGAWDAVDSPELARIHCSWIAAAVAAFLVACSDDELKSFTSGNAISSDVFGLDDFLRQAIWQIQHCSGQNVLDDQHVVGLRSLFLLDQKSKDNETPNDPWTTYVKETAKKSESDKQRKMPQVKRTFRILDFKVDGSLENNESEDAIEVCRLNNRRVFEKVSRASVGKWTFIPDEEDAVERLARNLARFGPEFALAAFPFEVFSEKLVTADREEIGRFRIIRRLLQQYQRFANPKRPLCLAVFGKPGTGKSFVVKEIARAVFGSNTKFLTFNLSQFSNPRDLIGSFHQVRDSVLKREKTVVFWDEFDCPLAGADLGWLRYFLAPMQDGEFQEDQITHSIGKAVFVFAGGIYSKWDEFKLFPSKKKKGPDLSQFDGIQLPTLSINNEDSRYGLDLPVSLDIRTSKERWNASKAPDFQSRLQGHLDILNPNGDDCDEAIDQFGLSSPLLQSDDEPLGNFVQSGTTNAWTKRNYSNYLRRAFLLRHALREREGKLFHGDRLEIEYGVLDALLFNKRYRYGARSIEAILTMSELAGKSKFTRSDLPQRKQLEMHVETMDVFEKLLSASQEKSIEPIGGEDGN